MSFLFIYHGGKIYEDETFQSDPPTPTSDVPLTGFFLISYSLGRLHGDRPKIIFLLKDLLQRKWTPRPIIYFPFVCRCKFPSPWKTNHTMERSWITCFASRKGSRVIIHSFQVSLQMPSRIFFVLEIEKFNSICLAFHSYFIHKLSITKEPQTGWL